MNRCHNCGTEYEGNFCPECGERKLESKICPECGKELDGAAKFCNECGHSFVKAKEKEKRVKAPVDICASGTGKIYGILRYVPAVMLLLFAFLLFMSYLGPVIVMNDIMFGTGETESMGNMYSDYNGILLDFPELETTVNTFIVLAAVAAAVGVAAVILSFLPQTKDRGFKVGDKTYTVGGTVALVAYLFYIAVLVVTALVFDKVKGFDEGMGLLSVGVCPKLTIAFSTVFAVLSAAAHAARIVLGRAYPALSENEERRRAERRAERAKEGMPDISVDRVPFLHFAVANMRLKKSVTCATVLMIINMLVIMPLLIGFFITSHVSSMISPHYWLLIGLVFAVYATIVSCTRSASKWSVEKFVKKVGRNKNHEKGKRSAAVFVLYFLIWFVTAFFIAVGSFIVLLRAYIVYSAVTLVLGIVFAVLADTADRRDHKLAVYLFGVPAPAPDARPIVDFDEHDELALYYAYKTAVKHKCAPVYDGDVLQAEKSRRIKLGVMTAVCVAVSVFALIAMPMLTYKFSAGHVSLMKDGYISIASDSTVTIMFGKPDNETVTEDYGGNHGCTLYEYEYFGKKYKKIAKLIDKTDKQIEKAAADGDAEKLAELAEKSIKLNTLISQLDYEYLKVSFVKTMDRSDGCIGVELDKNKNDSRRAAKSVKSAEIMDCKILLYTGAPESDVYVECFYTDGSYRFFAVPSEAFSDVDCDSTGAKRVEWTDKWGSCAATVDVVNSISGETGLMNGNWGSAKYELTVDEQKNADGTPNITASVFDFKLANERDSSGIAWDYGGTEIEKFGNYITKVHLDETAIDALAVGLNFKNVSEFVVDESNENIMSLGGVVYSRNGKELVCVPCGYKGSTFAVSTDVEIIRKRAFKFFDYIYDDNGHEWAEQVSNLEYIYIPSSVKEFDISDFYYYQVYFYNKITILAEASESEAEWFGKFGNRFPSSLSMIFGCASLVPHTYEFTAGHDGETSTVKIESAFVVNALPMPTETFGLCFAGWYDDPECGGAPVTAPLSRSEDTVFYALLIPEAEYNYYRNGTWAFPLSAVLDKEYEPPQSSLHVNGRWFEFTPEQSGSYEILGSATVYYFGSDGMAASVAPSYPTENGISFDLRAGVRYFVNNNMYNTVFKISKASR